MNNMNSVKPDIIDEWLLSLGERPLVSTQPGQTEHFLKQSGSTTLAPPWPMQTIPDPSKYSFNYPLVFDEYSGRSRSFSGPAPNTNTTLHHQDLQYRPHYQQPSAGAYQLYPQELYNDNNEGMTSEPEESSISSSTPDLDPKEAFLLHAKDEQKLSWRELAEAFQATFSETRQVAALQMRYRRLKRRLQAREDVDLWQDQDNRAFLLAREYWATKKFEIISRKMVEFGAKNHWTPEACALKWAELEGRMPHHARRRAASTQGQSGFRQ